ncbi:MAG: outer membrane protein assembly factor BamD [Pseudomonadota bacterium]
MRSVFLKPLLLIPLCIALVACETLQGEKEEYPGYTEDQFYTEAKAAMDKKSYSKAIELFEKLEARYPFGKYAAQAQLDVAYCYYKNDEPESAIAAVERFIKINPRNPSVDYAYYLKGLVNYNRGIGFLDRFLPTDSSQRDPGPAREAFRDFSELVRRFPDSRYVDDARQRITSLRNNLAMYEIHVADYYMRRKAYLAAANRAVYVVKKYQRTPAVPLALEIMEKAYDKLGLEDLAEDAKRVYALNYPNGAPPAEKEDATIARKIWNFMELDR